MRNKKNSILKFLNFFMFTIFLFANVFAQATTTSTTTSTTASTKYGNDTILTMANQLCSQYSGFKSVYGSAGVGGGGSVPVDLTQLKPVLESIDRNTQLAANEIRDVNTLRYCTEYINMANASNKIANDTAKELKNLADNCYTDEKCLEKRVFDADIQRELAYANNSPLYGREISKLILNIDKKKPNETDKIDYTFVQYCNNAKKQGRNPIECITAPTTEDIITQRYYEAKNRVDDNQNNISSEYARNNGLIASRVCTKTVSGADPTTVKFYDIDCVTYKTDPAQGNIEAYKQIVNLPYNQAYSPASILGSDQNINNINTRVREGNLADPNLSSNFGSTLGGGTNPGGGPTGINLATVEPNYKKLVANLDVILNLYNVGRLAYASTTSVCAKLPVSTRSTTIANLDKAKKTYDDYKTDLVSKWTQAQKTPNENHNALAIQINFDIKDKVNQEAINKVYDAVKALLQTCVDAK